jgi:hypothetical protein
MCRKKATGETDRCGEGAERRRSLVRACANIRTQERCRKATGEAKKNGNRDARRGEWRPGRQLRDWKGAEVVK